MQIIHREAKEAVKAVGTEIINYNLRSLGKGASTGISKIKGLFSRKPKVVETTKPLNTVV